MMKAIDFGAELRKCVKLLPKLEQVYRRHNVERMQKEEVARVRLPVFLSFFFFLTLSLKGPIIKRSADSPLGDPSTKQRDR